MLTICLFCQVSYLIVDEMHEDHPDLIPDIYWDDVVPQDLPYTVAAERYRKVGPVGSTYNMEVPEDEQDIVMPVLEEEGEGEEDVKVKPNCSVYCRVCI